MIRWFKKQYALIMLADYINGGISGRMYFTPEDVLLEYFLEAARRDCLVREYNSQLIK